MRNFYEGVLKLAVVADFGGLNLIFKEGFALWQIMDGNVIPAKLGRGNIENAASTSRFELCFETRDPDTIHATLSERGTEFLHGLNTELWGQRTIRFHDPDRHPIEVGEAMDVFLRRVYNEESGDPEATARRTFTPPDRVRQYLGLNWRKSGHSW